MEAAGIAKECQEQVFFKQIGGVQEKNGGKIDGCIDKDSCEGAGRQGACR